MSMMSPTELAVLILIGVVMFGPDKVPDMARKAARVFHFLKNIANSTRDQLREDLGPKYADLQITDLNPKTFVRKYVMDDFQDDINGIKADLEGVRNDLDSSINDFQTATADAPQSPSSANEPVARTVALGSVPVPFDSEAT
ncbi:translocase [Acidipropionibacterium jensenii]|uniref:Sec-independent protein translocase subunit TatB n=1 Tax=Acidipropionibacterium jensenii TaxID=1749 RepID=UPI000BC31D1F|nr:Sec-independent protein translocase subunit TatB [Acidipropionibacterium jensenii]AZZ41727.1 translocase [Acidipropionibacterium jensenii]